MAVAPTQNHRTYWAVEAIGTAKEGLGTGGVTAFTYMKGVQSVGISTNFNLEQIFQLGQLEIYQDLEDIPDIEVSVEKVIEGDKALGYVAFFKPGTAAAAGHLDAAADAAIATTISGDQNNKVDVGFVVNQDNHEAVGDGDSLVSAWMSGMYLSSASFNFNTDGFFTESLNLVGNHQVWSIPAGGELTGAPNSDFGGAVEDLDTGSVRRREALFFDKLPAPLGTKKMDNATAGLSAVAGDFGDLAIASLNISVDFGREPMYRLGQKLPYHRYVTFPVEVTSDIEAFVTDPDDMVVQAYPARNNVQKAVGDDGTSTHQLKFYIQDKDVKDPKTAGLGATRHTFDLGKNNYLQSVTWNGLSTDGTNATITYSYRNFNRLDVTSLNDSA